MQLQIQTHLFFITKKEVYNLVENLDFVNSTIKANIDYEIPEQLFSL